MLWCFVIAPHILLSSSSWTSEAILHSYLWVSTGPLSFAVPPLHWSLKVNMELRLCRLASHLWREGVCVYVCLGTGAIPDVVFICTVKMGYAKKQSCSKISTNYTKSKEVSLNCDKLSKISMQLAYLWLINYGKQVGNCDQNILPLSQF